MRTLASLILPVTGFIFIILSFVGFSPKNSRKEVMHYTGSNTLSYDINKEGKTTTQPVTTEVSNEEGASYLTIISGKERQIRIAFVVGNELHSDGVYSLNDQQSHYASFQYSSDHCVFATDEYYDGILMIHRYDTLEKIIAGSFEFIAYSSSCDELVRVSDGNFDLKYSID
jgi:hypothetical protein